jgi:hypothetical protein
MTDEPKTSKWSVTLNGGEWGTVKYGIVECLRSFCHHANRTCYVAQTVIAGHSASART